MDVRNKLQIIKEDIPEGVKLVAVSKFHPASDIMLAYEVGQKVFGESKMQELAEKYELLPKDIEWHFIGHLQTNKVKKIIPYTHTIHSVDSWRLLSEIENRASKVTKHVNCLLEIHIAEENSKYGFTYESCVDFLRERKWENCKYAHIIGVMGMATNTDNLVQVRNEFKNLRTFFNKIKNEYFNKDDSFSEISMGMSHDYLTAIEEGATIVRIGSAIFGDRT